jgi:hypothetical protein
MNISGNGEMSRLNGLKLLEEKVDGQKREGGYYFESIKDVMGFWILRNPY